MIGEVTEGKYLSFREKPTSNKTKVWDVHGRGTTILLGEVKFRPQWRCYVFQPGDNTLFDFKCLTDMTDFLQAQNAAWRKTL